MTKQELINKIEELKKEAQRVKDLANVQNLRQQAFKIFLNSSYGALGSAFYPCFDLDNAEAVTLSGQSVTREMVRYTNEILNKLAGTENDEFVVAGDTDSVFSETQIKLYNVKNVLTKLFGNLTADERLVYRNGKVIKTSKFLFGDKLLVVSK
jgi:DNA polymerase elongation subunit (family B)